MHLALVYLVRQFFYRIYEFFVHWYGHGFLIVSGYIINILEDWDKTFALRITIKHFFRPLYQDYTKMGYILGVIFRSLRILLGAFMYFFIITLGVAAYIFWVATPLYIIFKIITS